MFIKYQHIERLGTDEVEGILDGTCYIFPKIDGTNGCVWYEDGEIRAGSRNRELTLERDNQGFYKHVLADSRIKEFFDVHKNIRLFGEWLVPHSLKTYREDAWRRFYIFDVLKDDKYMNYDDYRTLLEMYDLDYIPCTALVESATIGTLKKAVDTNTFLLDEGIGEGIVIKNYDYVNKYGRITWAKIVRNEFKEKNLREFGPPKMLNKEFLECKIVEQFLTPEFIEKEFQKLQPWSTKRIGELLGRVWHEFIIEESWNFIKAFKNPTVDYKELNRLVTAKIKDVKKELF